MNQAWPWFNMVSASLKKKKFQQMLVLIHCFLWESIFYYFSNSIWIQICLSRRKC